MSIRRWLLVLLPGILLAQDDDPARRAEALPTRIETVASGGYWSRDHEDGFFRLVIESLGREELGSHVFLQWIRLDHDKLSAVVERTVPIKEIARRWPIVSQKFVLRGNQWEIILFAERHFPEIKATFTITPTANFSYAITTSE